MAKYLTVEGFILNEGQQVDLESNTVISVSCGTPICELRTAASGSLNLELLNVSLF